MSALQDDLNKLFEKNPGDSLVRSVLAEASAGDLPADARVAARKLREELEKLAAAYEAARKLASSVASNAETLLHSIAAFAGTPRAEVGRLLPASDRLLDQDMALNTKETAYMIDAIRRAIVELRTIE